MPTCREQLIEALGAEKQASCFENKTVAKEQGKEFRIENKSKKTICRVRVDDCLIESQSTKKCDFLFKICETEQYFLVELKGTEVSAAVEQIIATFDMIQRKLNADPQRFEGVIVSSSVPRAAEQRFRRLKEKYLRERRLQLRKVHGRTSVTV